MRWPSCWRYRPSMQGGLLGCPTACATPPLPRLSRPSPISSSLPSPTSSRPAVTVVTDRLGKLITTRLTYASSCEACSAFTHVAACTLARSPKIVTVIRRLQTFRRLHACSGCFRLERSPGGPCTHWKSAALSRRTWKPDIRTRFLGDLSDCSAVAGTAVRNSKFCNRDKGEP